jgi:ADP-heptose:LPS heptosyltransferase
MQRRNRNLFRITRVLILRLPLLFGFVAKFKTPKKRLLIIKTDAIGDYILFRNFIEVVKKSELFKDHEIHLLGNVLWQDLARQYDQHYVSKFIFINSEALYEAPIKTFSLAARLFTNNYAVVLHPTFSRTFITTGIAGFTGAKKIIGFAGNTERIRDDYKKRTDKFYTQLLDLPTTIYSEFERSKFFFETVLNQPIPFHGPQIPTEATNKNGILIFPGSGVVKRSWEPDKFCGLLQLILKNTTQSIYLTGSNAEVDLCNNLAKNLPADRIHNLAGKTSLTELVGLIAKANLLISNETSAIHIAAATNTKSICVLGGGHFNRFLPYLGDEENKPICVYQEMDCYNCDWNCKFITGENDPYPCISAISLQSVWEQTIGLLA